MSLSRTIVRGLSLAASALALTASSGVLAQTAPATTTSPQADAQPNTGEIIVTAQRRSQQITQVPISIIANSGADLARAGVATVRDLEVVTPGFRQGSGQADLPTIRGIQSHQTDPGNDANVSLYIDGIYQANAYANNEALPDIDHIETLEGPQGTLFGRNATGGAIRIFTKEPSFTPTGSLDLSYGRFNEFTASGFVSAPLVQDKIAASLSGYFTRADGYDTNIVTGKHDIDGNRKNLRFKLLAKPTDTLKLQLIAGYSYRLDGDVQGFTTYNGDGNSIGNLVPGSAIPTRPHDYASNVPSYLKTSVWSVAAKADWDLGAGTLSSTTAYDRPIERSSQDADFSSANLLNYAITQKQRDFQQEVVFASNRFLNNLAQVTAGAFYFYSDGRYDPLVISGGATPFYIYARQVTHAYSGFGELNLTPTEHLSIIGGIRYSVEDRDANDALAFAPGRPDPLPKLGHVEYHSATPRASLRYQLDSGDNVYFTYSKGFKSGGFNISALQATPFKPETVDAFEVGVKTATRRAVSASLATFYYNYKNEQVLSFVGGQNVTANAASSHIWGIDALIAARPVHDLKLTTSIAYLHARFHRFPNGIIDVPVAPGCLCGNNVTTMPTTDLSGNHMPDSPDLTIGEAADYTVHTGAGAIDLSANVYHSSSYPIDLNDSFKQGAYWMVNSRIQFKPSSLPVSFYVWGKNLTNATVVDSSFIAQAGDGVVYRAPRTYGVGAHYEF